jgi:glycerol kinase
MGAAYLAGLGVGYFKSTDEITSHWSAGRIFKPRMSRDQREALRSGWSKALHGTKSDIHGNLP